MIRQFVKFSGGVPTKVVTLGEPLGTKPKKLLLIIPGNPGLASFYEEFMESISSNLRKPNESPIWAISHAGHEVPEEDDMDLPPYRGNESIYNLKGQIRHKISFIEEFVPKECDLTLIGHSIGCKMSIEIMRHFKQCDPSRKIRAFLLFPTIERMCETPNGRRTWLVVAYLRPILVFIAFLLRLLLPVSFLRKLASLHLGRESDTVVVDCAVELIDPTVVHNALSLAHNELLTVRDLNIDEIREILPDMRFYFGTIDDWCPLSYYEELRTKLGDDLDATVCSLKMEHAFVIQSSAEMGEIIAQWFNEY